MIENLWATPLFRQVVADGESFNRAFRTFVLEKMANEVGINKSNVGGWHSEEDLLSWPLPEISQLQLWIMKAVQATMAACASPTTPLSDVGFRCVAWANVSRRGDFHRPHNHPNSSWSGVYYVAVGDAVDDDQKGLIEFVDPRTGINTFDWPGNPFDRRVSIAPEPGLLLVFPSWLQHYVLPFEGNSERISIAFNLTVTAAK